MKLTLPQTSGKSTHYVKLFLPYRDLLQPLRGVLLLANQQAQTSNLIKGGWEPGKWIWKFFCLHLLFFHL